ncbi:MAG: tetratricopeptide repeat protein [Leptolyngbya sp.]|nr:tetratricopeptide repeat protein [Candidatus Melainabacteria bacterium]
MKIMVPLALSLAFIFSLVDAIPFGLAAAGRIKAAQNLYVSLPVSTIFGFHPAGSMELLAGANVKAKKYSSAERLYQSLFEIRKRFYGRESEPVADIYADLGNLYAKSKNVSSARDFYVKSILLSEKLKVSQGWGKVLNKLGQLEVEQGNFSASLAHYKDALKMREKIFGFDHPKVAETLVDMGALYHLMNDRLNENKCVDRARKIIKANQKPEFNSAFLGAFLSLSFFGLAYWLTSSNGYLTRLAFLKLQKRLEQIPASNYGERNSMLTSLVMLSNFRKLPTLTAQYESEIA